MSFLLRAATALVPLALATISIAFAITATMSKEWGIRHQYWPNITFESQWSDATLLYTEYRGPFIVCGQDPDNGQYVCTRHPPYGRGNTSCESWNATGSGTAAVYGDERLCQEIHWTGNLAIASTTFIGIAFLLTLLMSFIAIVKPRPSSRNPNSEQGTTQDSKAGTTYESQAPNSSTGGRPTSFILRITPWINGTLIFFFVIGAILYGFAQLYGLLAFTQSIPDNALYASAGAAGTINNNRIDSPTHGPWIQGKALGIYGSVAWLAAALTAIFASLVWSLPRVARSI